MAKRNIFLSTFVLRTWVYMLENDWIISRRTKIFLSLFRLVDFVIKENFTEVEQRICTKKLVYVDIVGRGRKKCRDVFCVRVVRKVIMIMKNLSI